MPQKLASVLREQRAESLIRQAQTIRDYPAGQERAEEAETHVREAMLQRLLGSITSQEEHRIFTILNYIMPEDAPSHDERAPLAPDPL